MPDQLLGSVALQDIQQIVANDVKRNDRRNEAFSGDTNPNLRILTRVLTAYSIFNRDSGYVQGMTDLVSPLVQLFITEWAGETAVFYDGSPRTSNEAEAFVFWNFVGMIELTQHERLFTDLAVHQEFVLTHVSVIHRPLKQLLKSRELNSLSFLFRPMILMYKRAFHNDQLWRLWDAIFTSEAPACLTRFVSAAILILLFPKMLLHTNGTLSEVINFADGFLGEMDIPAVLTLAHSFTVKINKADLKHYIAYKPIPDRDTYHRYLPKYLNLQ
jgi:hypothetical protein